MKNVFLASDSEEIIQRINQLKADSMPEWGKMTVAQMLAHCNVTYEMLYENKHRRQNSLVKFMLKLFVKKGVVNEVPYPKNSRTAPQFVISETKEFEK